MTTFSDTLLLQKLGKLVDTQESISLVSHCKHSVSHLLGMMHHRKHAKASVQVWLSEIQKASIAKKLTLLHLCNDVLQNSRRKGEEYSKEFGKILPECLPRLYRQVPSEIQAKINRLLNIWEERQVYPSNFIGNIRSKCTLLKFHELVGTATKNTDEFSKLNHALIQLQSAVRQCEDAGNKAKDAKSNVDSISLDSMQSQPEAENIVLKVDMALKTMTDYKTSLHGHLEKRALFYQELEQVLARKDVELALLGQTIHDADDIINNMQTLSAMLKPVATGQNPLTSLMEQLQTPYPEESLTENVPGGLAWSDDPIASLMGSTPGPWQD